SSFIRCAFLKRVKDRRFLRRNLLAYENELSPRRFERLQLPAAGNKVKELRAVPKEHKAFRAIYARGQSVRESLETIALECFIGCKRERLELRLMFVIGPLDFFLASDSEQQLGVDSAALGANDR